MHEEKLIPKTESAFRIEQTAAEPHLISEQALHEHAIAEHAEKGSFRSMWELLMQLRVLLPYLTRLAPLLDRGLLKAAPDMSEFRKDLQELRTGKRELSSQVRDQGIRLDRMEEQITRLRQIAERNESETNVLGRSLRSLSGWVKGLTALVALTVILLMTLLVFTLIHTGR